MDSVSREAGIRRREFSREEILDRTIFALINEGARVLEQGLALRAADIDVIYTSGYGFPAYRGGPMFFADRVGLRTVCDRVTALHDEFGMRWEPAPLLTALAARGATFRDYDAERTPAVHATDRASHEPQRSRSSQSGFSLRGRSINGHADNSRSRCVAA